MVAALGLAGISTAFSLLKMVQKRSEGPSSTSMTGTQNAAQTGQNLPPAVTGPASLDPAALFKALDADKSGGITKEELVAGLKSAVSGAGKSNGSFDTRTFGALLSVQEASQKSNRADKLFAKLDTDKSGDISAEELAAGLVGGKQVDASKNGLDALFAMIDKDKDGKISAGELKSAMENAAQNRHDRHHHRHDWSSLTTPATPKTSAADATTTGVTEPSATA